MMGARHESTMQRRIADGLYMDAMLLADEARGYFEGPGRDDRDMLGPHARVVFSCESLKVTTRLMHVLAFLLTRRAVDAGELTPDQALETSRRLGETPAFDGLAAAETGLPVRVVDLALRSVALHRRAALLDAALASVVVVASPVRALHQRLAGLV